MYTKLIQIYLSPTYNPLYPLFQFENIKKSSPVIDIHQNIQLHDVWSCHAGRVSPLPSAIRITLGIILDYEFVWAFFLRIVPLLYPFVILVAWSADHVHLWHSGLTLFLLLILESFLFSQRLERPGKLSTLCSCSIWHS